MRSHKSMLAVVALTGLISSGCQTPATDWSKLWWGSSTPKLQESKYPTPVKMAVIWSPAVFNQVGQQSTRGLGGRIYFYDAKNQPVPVEGQLVVYAYNDSQPGSDRNVPQRKFAFTPEQFTKHYSPSELGASYSIWIPWDAIGQPQVDVTVVPIFTSTSGHLVVGESSHNLLPGPTTQLGETQFNRYLLPPSPLVRPEPSVIQQPPQYAVQQASFEQGTTLAPPAAGPPSQPPGPAHNSAAMQTLSINLPDSMAEQLAAAPQQMSPTQRLAMQRAILTMGRSPAAPGPGDAALQPTTAPKAPVAAAPPPWMVQAPPQPARYAPPSPPAPAAPGPQPTVGPLPSGLSPATPPSGPPVLR
jgi:hypothetical protein